MKTIAEQWIEASEWDAKAFGVPSIITRTIAKELRKIAAKAKVFKPKIKFPKGEKPKSISQLKKELDKEFSIFVRMRGKSEIGLTTCVTCGYCGHWKHLQAGHYVPRQYLNTRWNEDNVHTQCGRCNGFNGGEAEKMADYIDASCGQGTSSHLKTISKHSFKLNRSWLLGKIEYYKKINAEKGIV